MKKAIVFKNVRKNYKQLKAVDGISLSIEQGEFFGLLGPNGAGKTSLIRIINQITIPDSGTVLFDGAVLKPEHVSAIGYLPEERGLYKTMKVGDKINLEFDIIGKYVSKMLASQK